MTAPHDAERRSATAPITTSDLLRHHRELLGYTQEEFALQHGFSIRAYNEMENGGKVSLSHMRALRDALQMGPQARAQFFRLVTGDAPSLKGLNISSGVDPTTANWCASHLVVQDGPAVLLDGGWNAVRFNEAWAELFSGADEVGEGAAHPLDHPLNNPMRFCLFHPAAPRMLLDYEESWLITAMCQFVHHFQLYPQNHQLLEIRRRIAADAYLHEVYRNRVREEFTERGVGCVIERDVEERALLVDGRRQTILFTIVIPWHAREYGYQMLTLTPVDNDESRRQRQRQPVEHHAPSRARTASDAIPPAPAPGAPGPATTASEEAIQPAAERVQTVGELLFRYRSRLGVSQEVLSRRPGFPVSPRTYRDWETGRSLPRKKYLPALAAALHMPDAVKGLLHFLITRGDPPTSGIRGGPAIAARSRRWVREHVDDRRQPAPFALMDGTWDVIACNNAYRRLFGHLPEPDPNHPATNGFRYVMFHPDARETLAGWYEEWMIPWMVEFGATLLRHHDRLHPEHAALLEEVESYPELWDAYTGPVRRALQGRGRAIRFEGDGDGRGLWLPGPDGDPAHRVYQPIRLTSGIPLHGLSYGYNFACLRPYGEPTAGPGKPPAKPGPAPAGWGA
ncbi:helix-turn-helix domain-containing protein [Streptomyces sp. NPDC057743]|uniref:helix-turn-helix domain-containing protein n=1 Tax=Streptomyces sp. NPDC057743 TaxID=3346236 RepID=UPI0036A5EBAA